MQGKKSEELDALNISFVEIRRLYSGSYSWLMIVARLIP